MQQEEYQVYSYIADYIADREYSPSFSEIADALGIAVTTVKQRLQRLWNLGYLCHPLHVSSMIYLTSKQPILDEAPIHGSDVPIQSEDSKQVFQYISNYIQQQHYGPDLWEIANALNLASTSVAYHVDWLKEAGYLHYIPGKFRSLRLVEQQLAS